MRALFLDRDGVINRELEGSYILHPDDFHFYDGVLDSFHILKEKFDLIIIVTNQRCIGKGLLSVALLDEMHDRMVASIEQHSGKKIDAIYYAPAIHDHDTMRKPNIGMGLQAQKDFPKIDFAKSIMVGNNFSDMKFGRKLGIKTIFLHTTKPQLTAPHELIDEQFESLLAFAQSLD